MNSSKQIKRSISMEKSPLTNSYEKVRKQRIKDNLKRFQELGVSKMVDSLNEQARTKKSVDKDQNKTTGSGNPAGPLRRSTRLRDVTYQEEKVIPRLRGVASTTERTRRGVATFEERSYPLKCAKICQGSLSSENPSCVKSLFRSEVSGWFYLHLPSKFCNDHFPKENRTIELEDEEGKIYDTPCRRNFTFLGWKSFVMHHKVEDGDAVLLELIQPTRLKVYVFRLANSSSEAKPMEIKQSRGNELVTKVKDSDADEDMVEVDAEQISKPRERRTRRKL